MAKEVTPEIDIEGAHETYRVEIHSELILSSELVTDQDNQLGIDYESILNFVRRYWNKTCPCGTFYESTDCAHFIGHALLVGGISVLGGDPAARCPQGIIIRAEELAAAFFNSSRFFTNVTKRGSFKETNKFDWGFLKQFIWKSHAFLLHEAVSPDGQQARIWGHTTNRNGEQEIVKSDRFSDGSYYRIAEVRQRRSKLVGVFANQINDNVDIPPLGTAPRSETWNIKIDQAKDNAEIDLTVVTTIYAPKCTVTFVRRHKGRIDNVKGDECELVSLNGSCRIETGQDCFTSDSCEPLSLARKADWKGTDSALLWNGVQFKRTSNFSTLQGNLNIKSNPLAQDLTCLGLVEGD